MYFRTLKETYPNARNYNAIRHFFRPAQLWVRKSELCHNN